MENNNPKSRKGCAKAVKGCGCAVFLLAFLIFILPFFIMGISGCPVFDKGRYETVIRDLRTQGAIPSDLNLEGVYRTGAQTIWGREETYVFTGTTTNTAFLYEKGYVNKNWQGDRDKWDFQRKDFWVSVSPEGIIGYGADESRQRQEDYFNAFMRKAKLPFERTEEMPFFYIPMTLSLKSIWLALDGETVYVVVFNN